MGKRARHRPHARLDRPGRSDSPRSLTPDRRAKSSWTTTLVAIGLIVAVLVVFTQTVGFDFVTYDDPDYVTENQIVQRGLTDDGVRWAFTTFHGNNWHPLTWLSHMSDCQLFGLDAGRHHLTNVVLHTVAVVLLFTALRSMTGSLWPSALVAALFAIHPLRAESVAWVSERKDVLSVTLAMVVLLAWSWYVKRPGIGRYLVVAIAYALGLMAKPMLVTLPFVLILLDVWPLGRVRLETVAGAGAEVRATLRDAARLVAEKLPLVAMAAASGVVTIVAQRGAMGDLEELPLAARLGNALVAWIAYVGKSLWPTKLAVFYPHPAGGTPWWHAVVAGVVLIVGTVAVLRQLRRRPYLTVGWLWFLGTLVPVIGLVQVGSQAMADRYTYFPQIGLWLMAAWGLKDVVAWRPQLQSAVVTALAAILVAYSALAWRQTATWADSAALYRQALAVTEANWVAHANYSEVLLDAGHVKQAAGHAARALEINPDSYVAAVMLGKSLSALGRPEDAAEAYSLARRLRPELTTARFNLGNAYKEMGEVDRAMELYREVLADEPTHVPARNNIGVELLLRDDPESAAEVLCDPAYAETPDLNLQFNCGLALNRLGRFDSAVERFRRAIAIDARHAPSWRGLAFALLELGRRDEAAEVVERALKLEPEHPWSLHASKRIEESATSDTETHRPPP